MTDNLLLINKKYIEVKDEIMQRAAKKAGVNVVENLFNEGLELCKQLGKLDFWCNNDTLHINNPNYRDNGCCFTHTIGLPQHSATKQEMPLTPYQVEFCNRIIHDTKFIPTSKENEEEERIEFLRKPHLYHINKGRQMGFTEIVLRLIQYFCFSRYESYDVGIIAGNTGTLSNKDLRRFARLFKFIPNTVEQWIKATKEGTCLKIINDTTVWSFPASEEAMTGRTNFKCVFMDESAKWRLIEDRDVFNSIMPIVKSNGSDFFLVSTPKKPQKTFYHIHKEPGDFVKLQYNIWRAEGNLYTKSQIEELLASKEFDPNQEYLCQFTIGKDSILGGVTDADREKGFRGFDVGDNMDEDDNFVESEDDDEQIHEDDNSSSNSSNSIDEKWQFD